MPYRNLISKHLNDLKENIKVEMEYKNLDNTGNASKSLEVKGTQLLGNDYIYFLDQGRRPGKFPPVATLVQWVRSKLGLEGTEAKQVAFLVGRKISREGTDIFKDKSKGLQLDELIDDMIENLLEETLDIAKVEALKFL